jgi:hypothetical protein
MVREYNKDFEGKCCDDNFGVCDWTCAQILERIQSRAPIGMVYSREEIDTAIATIQSQVSAAVASNSVIIGDLLSRPAAVPGNSGYLFITSEADINDTYRTTGTGTPGTFPGGYDDPDGGSNEDFFQQVFVSDGTRWIEIIDREAYTAQNQLTGDMEKATYDTNDDGTIDVAAGGLGANYSATPGVMVSDGGGSITPRENYRSTLSTTPGLDVILTNDSESVQILNPSTNIDVILSTTPTKNTFYRLINLSITATITVRDSIGGTIVIELKDTSIGTPTDVRAADFHFDIITGQWVVILQNVA